MSGVMLSVLDMLEVLVLQQKLSMFYPSVTVTQHPQYKGQNTATWDSAILHFIDHIPDFHSTDLHLSFLLFWCYFKI